MVENFKGKKLLSLHHILHNIAISSFFVHAGFNHHFFGSRITNMAFRKNKVEVQGV